MVKWKCIWCRGLWITIVILHVHISFMRDSYRSIGKINTLVLLEGKIVVQLLSCVWFFATPWTAARQSSLFFTISRSLLKLIEFDGITNWSRWCHPTISSSVALFSFCPQSFPGSGSLAMSRLFSSGCQSIGASALVSVLSASVQGWFPLGLTALISLQSKGLSTFFSSTTVQKHQFFGSQPLWSNSPIGTWPLEKP